MAKEKQWLVIAEPKSGDGHARYQLLAADKDAAARHVATQEMRMWLDAQNPDVDVVTGREGHDAPFEVVSVEEA